MLLNNHGRTRGVVMLDDGVGTLHDWLRRDGLRNNWLRAGTRDCDLLGLTRQGLQRRDHRLTHALLVQCDDVGNGERSCIPSLTDLVEDDLFTQPATGHADDILHADSRLADDGLLLLCVTLLLFGVSLLLSVVVGRPLRMMSNAFRQALGSNSKACPSK